MKILVCGDRNWTDIEKIFDILSQYPKDTIIIEGEANGADKIASIIAKELGMTVESYPAEWGKYGKAAGPLRNRKMLEIGKPDKVLAFHNNISTSKGTKNMISIAKKANILVELYTTK